jgi:hypothetical protein
MLQNLDKNLKKNYKNNIYMNFEKFCIILFKFN